VKNKFITFEGPEGSGKSTVMKAVEKALKKNNIDVVTTREPGGIAISEQIRDVILDVKNTEMDARTEALLYAASRRQHIVEKVWPALAQGKVVLCDRFIDSSLAYQGFGRKLGLETVMDVNKFAIEQSIPDLTIFIDIPPSVGLKRVFGNHREINRLDLESIAFHERVYEGYQALISRYPERIKVVDGNRGIDAVVKDALSLINGL